MAKSKSTDSKKERILAAALKLFSQKGFHATSTKEIANECGVAEGLIFYHYGDKRKLLLHIVKNFSFALHAQRGEGYLSGKTLEDALVQYGLEYLQFLKDHIDYLMLIWSPEMIQDEAVSQEVSHLVGSIGSAGTRMLKQGMGPEQPAEATLEVAMSMMTSSILLYFMLHYRFGKSAFSYDEETYVRELVQLLLHGLYGQSQQG
ncbi:TetR/AcrR family transcriptional regulator [Paenibacillus sp. KQZ6P-2]|uniref:TetR/AcrR family transcriptional regulator n=1 Tax=Paenibacillus mangrovi TaxID=2931978 RepID=A0A9X1WXY1_9BACL|nr:TetR/AcrR family transcriptional regulator [Paenibacillus mangrovi]MCJ8014119.1 TetR/AcrR family transcriptional regulator [Paenibacillus mangrovi]